MNIAETMREMEWIDALPEPERTRMANNFMAHLRAESVNADANVGYLTGYYAPDMMLRLQDLFDVVHPIFGRRILTPEEAFEMGRQWAEGKLGPT